MIIGAKDVFLPIENDMSLILCTANTVPFPIVYSSYSNVLLESFCRSFRRVPIWYIQLCPMKKTSQIKKTIIK